MTRPPRPTPIAAVFPARHPSTHPFPALIALGLALLSTALCGCASNPKPTWTPSGDPVADAYAARQFAPARDRILWDYRGALAALRRDDTGDAKALLDDAIATLNGLQGPDPAAQAARGVFTPEARKTFVGEPYERAMAYYYRGVLYWMDGELDNARACFRSAQFMDSDAENQSYSGDYVLFDFLDGLATAKLGGDGTESFKRATTSARMAPPTPFRVEDNVAFFIELGQGPQKFATGRYGEQLRFSPGHSRAVAVRLTSGAQTVTARALDDLSFQATTRGGRVMDHVLANKAVFKQTTDAAGTVAIVGGAVMAAQGGRNSAVNEVGLGLVAAGILTKILSAATTPQADTRTWESLPQFLAFALMTLAPGEQAVTAEFLDAQGSVIAGLTRTLHFTVPAPPGEVALLVSDRSSPAPPPNPASSPPPP